MAHLDTYHLLFSSLFFSSYPTISRREEEEAGLSVVLPFCYFLCRMKEGFCGVWKWGDEDGRKKDGREKETYRWIDGLG